MHGGELVNGVKNYKETPQPQGLWNKECPEKSLPQFTGLLSNS